MNQTATPPTIKKIKVGEIDVFLENFELGRGKLTISGSDRNYSYFWGAMGGTLENFILRLDGSYFANKLKPSYDEQVIDIKGTFRNVRTYIREELYLPWYKHVEFQKDMREKLNYFQQECEEDWGGQYTFINCFNTKFIDELDFRLIEDYDRKYIERDFAGISEGLHYFLETKESPTYDWLVSFLPKLKKAIKNAV